MLEGKVLLKGGDIKKIQPTIKESLTSSQILLKKGTATKKDVIKKGKLSKKAENSKEETSEEDSNSKVNEANSQEHDEDSSILLQGKDELAPFVLLVRIFGKLLHNYLCDLGASSNVIPLVVCQKLGITPAPTRRKVTQLDKIKIPIMGELNNIHMQLAIDPTVQNFINISVVDIPDTYGMLLSRVWS